MGQGTRLAVDLGRSIETDEVYRYGSESSKACNGVNLTGGGGISLVGGLGDQIPRSSDIAHQYRPMAGSTSSNDTPLKVQRGEKLPARNAGLSRASCFGAGDQLTCTDHS